MDDQEPAPIERLACIRGPAGKGPSVFAFGTSKLFFIGQVLYAVEALDLVKVRDDIELTPRNRRLLNQWRPHSQQERVDFYTFAVFLNDALLSGMSDVRNEIFQEA